MKHPKNFFWITATLMITSSLIIEAAQPENNKRKREDTPVAAPEVAATSVASLPTAATAAAASAPAASQAASEQENSAKKARTEPKPATDELLSLIKAGDITKIKAYIASQAHLPLAERTEQWTKYLFKTNNKEILTIILDSIDINYTYPTSGTTHLILAAANNHAVLVELLLQKKADPNAQNKHGGTALLYASHHMNYDIVRLLLAAGAKATTQLKSGQTSLSYAYGPVAHNSPALVQNRSNIILALKMAVANEMIADSVKNRISFLEKENAFDIMRAEAIEALVPEVERSLIQEFFMIKYKKELEGFIKPGLESVLLGAQIKSFEKMDKKIPQDSNGIESVYAVNDNITYLLAKTSPGHRFQLWHIDKENKHIRGEPPFFECSDRDGYIQASVFIGNRFLITAVNFFITPVSGNELAWIWNIENPKSPKKIAILKCPNDISGVKSMALSPNKKYLAIGCRDHNRLLLWDIENIETPVLINFAAGKAKFGKDITRVTFSPDSRMIATISGIQKIRLSMGFINKPGKSETFQQICPYYSPAQHSNGYKYVDDQVEFVDNQNVLAMGRNGMGLINMLNHSTQTIFEGKNLDFPKILFTSQRKHGFSASTPFTVWNFEEPQRIKYVSCSSYQGRIIALSADGRYMLRDSGQGSWFNHDLALSDLHSTQTWIVNELKLSQLFLLLMLDKKHNKRVDLLLQDPYHKLIFDGLNSLFRQHLLKIGARALIDDYSGNALKAKELQNIIVDYLTDIPEESDVPRPAATASTAAAASPSASATVLASANGKYTIAQ